RRQVRLLLKFPTAAIPSSVGWLIQRCEGESESCAGFELSRYFNVLGVFRECSKRALFQR
ncbi:hypothetical protein, partial [Pseudomonas sp. R62]|uniref:hypothetical protein n=1 Tax=Pseudomonas sp. R62 TaxID=1144884 RepID=UPI001EE689CB